MKALKKIFDCKHALPIIIILAVLITMVAISASVAWFANRTLTPTGGAVIPGYFAGGDGSEENPYIITHPIHLYNLAWLQDKGRFNQPNEDGTYPQYHFILADDLDMSGLTLPPIGTREHPFIGTFRSGERNTDGTYDYNVRHKITSLTVSNTIGIDEIEKRPQDVTELNYAEVVGMFGVIGVYDLDLKEGDPKPAYSSIVPSVSNFYLEDPIVRAQSEKTLIGLIAGYVNGKVHNVGVKGGRIESGEANKLPLSGGSISYYALIGNKADSVNWGGITAPGAGSGAIKVDVNDTDESGNRYLQNLIKGNDYKSDKYVAVPESAKDRAFITGSNVSVSSVPGGIGTYYFHNGLVTGNGGTYTPSKDDSTPFTPGNSIKQGFLTEINSEFEENADFYTRVGTSSPGSYTIDTGSSSPIFSGSGMTPVTFSDGVTRNLPSNGIWFMPSAPGNGIISFVIADKGADYRFKSIYKYQRDSNGNIINIIETKLRFAIKQFSNKTVIFFEYAISAADADGTWEFFIGTSTGSTDSAIEFYFLALAGSGTKGSVVTDQSKELLHVNFVHDIGAVGDDVAANGMIVTTFDIKLTDPSAERAEYITFTRESMEDDAAAEAGTAGIAFDLYSHSAIILPPTDPSG